MHGTSKLAQVVIAGIALGCIASGADADRTSDGSATAQGGDEPFIGTTVFAAQRVITDEADGAESVFAADLDGDGDADVLEVSRQGGEVAWYENLGDGAFSAQRVITTDAAGARSVFAADLDGDGDPDVLLASASDDKIAWHENLGDGDFADQRVITNEADGAHAVHAADLDGDGDADVLSASADDDKIAWYENLGNGAFSDQRVISADADGARSVHAADLDGDGDADVLIASAEDDTIAWHENLGDGDFAGHRVITRDADGAWWVVAADLDGDGDADVLSASYHDGKIAWHANLGGGAFSEQRVITADAAGAVSVHAADLDGDGDADVLSASQDDDKVAWHENLGAGAFSAQRVLLGSGGSSVHAADLNGDGDADVLAASYHDDKIAWHENLGGAGFSARRAIAAAAGGAESVYAADLDGDGDPDILAASYNAGRIAWHENLGRDGFSEPRAITTDAHGAESVHAADLDGDGDADVLAASSSFAESSANGKIAWYENQGGGFSEQRVISTKTDGATSVHAVDLDGDGDLDVISAARDDDKIAWHENQGDSTFADARTITNDAKGAEWVRAADLDGDGDHDVLTASLQDGKIAWHENQGGGDFSDQRVLSTAAGSTVAAADLDADGDLDVLTGVAWLENLGDGAFSEQRVIAASGASSVLAADLDADGDLDILAASYTSIAWQENLGMDDELGHLRFAAQRPISFQALSANALHAADLDGDGDADVLAAAWGDDRIAWHENVMADQPTAPTASPRLVRVAAGARTLTVSWEPVPETRNGRSPIENYVAIATPTGGGPTGRCVATAATYTCTIPGLAPDVVVYEVTVQAENAVGAGPLSAPVAATPIGSHRLVAENAADAAGWGLASGANTVIGAPFHSPPGRHAAGAVYLLDTADMAAADAADTLDDGMIDLANAAGQGDSWKLVGETAGDAAGWSVAAATGHDGDIATRAYTAIGAPRNNAAAGAVYLVAAKDLATADAADGTQDGVVDLANIAAQANSWKIVGGAGDRFGASVAPAGDIDGDGHAELLVHGTAEHRGTGFGTACVLSLNDAHLAAADEADGTTDGVIESRRLAARAGFWEIFGESLGGHAGSALAAAGDADGDGRDDLLLGAPYRSPAGVASGTAFLAAGADFPTGPDGAINMTDLADRPASYALHGEAPFDQAGTSVASAGDATGDGRADLIVGAPGHSGRGGFAGGAAYLIASSSLAAADGTGTSADGTVNLANIAAQPDSWKFEGRELFGGAGAALSSTGDIDGDGLADLVVSSGAGSAYLIAVADLPEMDAADGSKDGVIVLANAAAQPNSWRIAGRGQIAGRDLRLSPAGDIDGDGNPDLLLAASGAIWLLAVSDLPVVLANFDAADGTTDGTVDIGILAERIGAPHRARAVLASMELYQGPLARTWQPHSGASTVHVPPILARRGALVAHVAHTTPAAPELSVRVSDAGGTALARRLQPLRDPETTPPSGPGDRWETAYVLDLPDDLHQTGNQAHFEIAGDGAATIGFHGLTLPPFDITFVPIRSAAGEPPRIDANAYVAPMLDLLPIANHRARVGPALDFRGGQWSAREAARQLLHRWNVEAADGEFYHGVFAHPGDASACGHAFQGGPVAVSAAPGGACPAGVAVRSVGSNLSLRPAPGCGAANADPRFPYPLGGIGPWRSWLFDASRFVGPNDGFSDFMSGCGPAFVSDYHYRKAAEFLSAGASAVPSPVAPGRPARMPERSLALTGSWDASGAWALDRVSVSDMPPRAVRPDGAHVLVLLGASGLELHSEPLTAYAESHGTRGGWVARVPVPDGRVRYVVVRAQDGRVLLEDRIGTATMDAVGDAR